MQETILIIANNNYLEIILKQYFKEIKITSDRSVNDPGIIIDQTKKQEVSIAVPSKAKNWVIAKPVTVLEVINIIEQALQIIAENVIHIGPITFYPEQKVCKYNDEDIVLTAKESEILLYLAKHPNQEINKVALLNNVWGYNDDILTHTLETHIYNLRNKFAGKSDIIVSRDSTYLLAM